MAAASPDEISFEQRFARMFSTPLALDSYSWYQHMLQTHSVYFNPDLLSWQVFRYEEVQRVLLDTQTFSSQVYRDEQFGQEQTNSIIGMDPPRHRKIRGLVTQVFTPRMVARLEPRIVEIVSELLDVVVPQGRMDVVDDLAFSLPVTVIAELLGIPMVDQGQLRGWAADAVGIDNEAREKSSEAMALYFKETLEQRRRVPREDLITELANVEVDGERLTDWDIFSLCFLLLLAGHETTTNLIANAIVCLDEHPEVMALLRAEPALWPTAVEELLRFRGPVHTSFRIVKARTVIAGQVINAGQLVLPMFAAANLDEKQFPRADVLDIRRTPNRHLGFGHGIHFCLGAPLARMEVQIALRAMLERLPNLRRDRSIALEVKPSFNIYGLRHVPVVFG